MAAPLKPLHLLLLLTAVVADPTPGRVPKVYNALITSNQNLEPSKAYPVYQPVLHDVAFPFQPAFFYGDYPITNGIQPAPSEFPKDVRVNSVPPPSVPTPQEPESTKASPLESSQSPSRSSSPFPNMPPSATPAPPLAPNTESPIPLNEFGLPSQVLPLGRINPAYSGFTQVGPFTYTYPSIRFYDPYDPFGFNPYANLPQLYRPFPNLLEPSVPGEVRKEVAPPSVGPTASAVIPSGPTPPQEPADLNVLNYASKDPAIPNVPPPPLPHGGLKADNAE